MTNQEYIVKQVSIYLVNNAVPIEPDLAYHIYLMEYAQLNKN